MTEKKGVGFGISGFTLSIAGIIGLLFNLIFSTILLFVGLIFCSIQFKRNKTKLAKAGLIISIVGLILAIVLVIIWINYLLPYFQEIVQQTQAY